MVKVHPWESRNVQEDISSWEAPNNPLYIFEGDDVEVICVVFGVPLGWSQ